jgi:proteasome accessory factor B
MSSAKLERLLNLTALLLDARLPVRADAIQDQIAGYPQDKVAFRRSFERDKDELRAMGVPLVTEAIPGETAEVLGYRIPREQYALRDPELTADELAALHLAASAVRAEGTPAREGLLKLGGLVGDGGGDVGLDVAVMPADPNLATIFGAVSERHQVVLTYHGAERRIDPYRLEYQRGRWYVSGYDHHREEERVYRLDRVEGAVAVDPATSFEPPSTGIPGAARAAWELGTGDPVPARVRIDAVQAAWAVQHVGPTNVVAEHPDGAVEVVLPVTNPEAFRSFVLSFLEHAEVVEPPDLRADVVAWLEALADGAGEGRS